HYPDQQLKAGESGYAYGQISIMRSGGVTIADVIGSKPPFAVALREALTATPGTPARLRGPENMATYSVYARFKALASKAAGREGEFDGAMTVSVTEPMSVDVIDTPAGEGTGTVSLQERVSNERYPDPDEFVMLDTEPAYDAAELLQHVKY